MSAKHHRSFRRYPRRHMASVRSSAPLTVPRSDAARIIASLIMLLPSNGGCADSPPEPSLSCRSRFWDRDDICCVVLEHESSRHRPCKHLVDG